MDWKEEIGNYFGQKGHYRLDQNNHLLFDYLEEYVNYIDSFSGMNGKIENKEIGGASKRFEWKELRIFRDSYFDWDFKAYLRYEVDEESNNICLSIKFASDRKNDLEPLEDRPQEDQWYIFKLERFYEPEIFEKEYILQLLNDRYKAYMERLNEHLKVS